MHLRPARVTEKEKKWRQYHSLQRAMCSSSNVIKLLGTRYRPLLAAPNRFAVVEVPGVDVGPWAINDDK